MEGLVFSAGGTVSTASCLQDLDDAGLTSWSSDDDDYNERCDREYADEQEAHDAYYEAQDAAEAAREAAYRSFAAECFAEAA